MEAICRLYALISRYYTKNVRLNEYELISGGYKILFASEYVLFGYSLGRLHTLSVIEPE